MNILRSQMSDKERVSEPSLACQMQFMSSCLMTFYIKRVYFESRDIIEKSSHWSIGKI
jgi:hypothetical protein